MSLLLNPFVLRALAVIATVAALLFAWNSIAGHYEAIGYQRAKEECRAQKAKDDLATAVAYRNNVKQMLDERKKADHEAEERYRKLAADFDAVRRANLGLRHTVADLRGKLPAASADAVRATAAAALVVFGECADEVERLAQAADGHAADARALSDAWPK